MWCIPFITPEYKKRMLDVLEVYERPYNHQFPVVCLDEKNKQLLADTRATLRVRRGKPARADYAYDRHGTCNLFVAVEPKGGRRIVRVTRRRTKKDYASFLAYLVEDVYTKAEKIILVEDNLNTHGRKVLLEVLGKTRGSRLAQKIEWHFTPKHASWLDQAEIEIHALERQCLNRRIPDFQTMQKEIAACVRQRNRQRCRINWQFTRAKAIEKFRLS